MAVESYRDLVAYQKARELAIGVYRVTSRFPKHEMYGLVSQLRRAAVSVPSNIAEGQGRQTSGEFVQFLCTARGSLFEIETQISIATELGYLENETAATLSQRVTELARIMQGLISSIQAKRRGASA